MYQTIGVFLISFSVCFLFCGFIDALGGKQNYLDNTIISVMSGLLAIGLRLLN